jgi:putative phosphonate metabolism protein
MGLGRGMERYALYFMPPSHSDLGAFGTSVIGRDAETGADVAFADALRDEFDDWPVMTAEPRRYGFHATLKAPFRLSDGMTEQQLCDAVRDFAAKHPPVRLPPLIVAPISRFVALVPTAPDSDLSAFAASVVQNFDSFRAPLTPAERARRLRAPLTERQIALLDAWGYPYVLDAFRFHMTLTGPLPDQDQDRAVRVLTGLFETVMLPDSIGEISIAKQEAPDAPFRVFMRASFGGVPTGS